MKRLLVIGGSGMLGRPVVRRLVKDGFAVKVMARSPEKAKKTLPNSVQVVPGDLQSVPAVTAALKECDAVYVSVDTPPKASFRPETDGLRNVVAAAKSQGTPRLLVLSAYGVSTPLAKAHPWWHVREKVEAQNIAKRSGLPWTIFEPTWFMESLPLFVQGGRFINFSTPGLRPSWIAADDYGRIISAALTKDIGQEETVPVQGPDRLSIEEAADRFIQAYDPSICRVNLPRWVLRIAGLFQPQAKELFDLLVYYSQHGEPAPIPAVWDKFAKPLMNVESYAQYVRATGDFPWKNLKSRL